MDPGWKTTRIPEGRDLYECTLLFRGIPAQLRLSAQEKRVLKAFAQNLAERITNGYTFTCLLTNDKELRRLNGEFLGHDYATDVLSFPAASGTGIGEMAISVERAAAQALAFGHSVVEEIRLLMLHGALHLTGHDHEIDRGEMKRTEQKWRAEFALPQTLIARAARSALVSGDRP